MLNNSLLMKVQVSMTSQFKVKFQGYKILFYFFTWTRLYFEVLSLSLYTYIYTNIYKHTHTLTHKCINTWIRYITYHTLGRSSIRQEKLILSSPSETLNSYWQHNLSWIHVIVHRWSHFSSWQKNSTVLRSSIYF